MSRALTIVLLLFASACEQVPDAELVDTIWTLKSIEQPGESTILAWPSIAVNITFSNNGKVSGSSFCNAYFGDYSMGEANSMDIVQFRTTLVYCGNEQYREDNYYEVLLNIDSYAIYGNLLELTAPDGAILTFRQFN